MVNDESQGACPHVRNYHNVMRKIAEEGERHLNRSLALRQNGRCDTQNLNIFFLIFDTSMHFYAPVNSIPL